MVCSVMSDVFDKIIPSLRGLRTRIVCPHPFVRDLLLTQILIPSFSDRRIFLMIYSEALYRRFVKFSENRLDDVELYVIKVGKRPECRVGRLFAFVEQGDPRREANDLIRVLDKLGAEDVLIMHSSMGFFFELLGDDNIREILEMFSILPPDITLVGFKSGERTIDSLINELYDVIIRIERDENMLDKNYYTITVEWTFKDYSIEFGRFRVRRGRID